ncbi:hypothetical protein ANCDUO_21274 [Ancylostoma duodenale]|uniref:Uncharacterized protein n=1 Tax=Ancylostoma duodenale TaxID=51022 RepID=A0A0C2BXE4_9BILA|nr:hypothetical protein ANCDUO_21274 [Ancylostoma duodenale]
MQQRINLVQWMCTYLQPVHLSLPLPTASCGVPAPPNKIVMQVQNVDVGVTGNLGGQIVMLLPIPLTGIIQLNIYQNM